MMHEAASKTLALIPRHVAIVMDGNGRWAEQRGFPRAAGHRRGAEVVREVTRAARAMGLPALTLYAFSAQNWARPASEIATLMELLLSYLEDERDEILNNGIRLTAIGDTARLPERVQRALAALCRDSAANDAMTLCLALSYGGRESIVQATRALAQRVADGRIAPTAIDEAAVSHALATCELPPLDLLIRTSGEQRLSNFLLWEAAYAELFFTPTLWPDFSRAELTSAIADFARRERRYGGVVALGSI